LDCLAVAVEMGAAGRSRAISLYDEKMVVDLQLTKIHAYAISKGLKP
jgi:hypothetical protein